MPKERLEVLESASSMEEPSHVMDAEDTEGDDMDFNYDYQGKFNTQLCYIIIKYVV